MEPVGQIKCKNIHVIGVPEGEEGEQEVEKIFEEIMMENFPNLGKELDIQPQEAQRIPRKRNPKRPTARHIIIKMPKFKYKKRIFKAAREKPLVTFKGEPIRLGADFSREIAEQKGLAQNIQSDKKPGSTTKNTLSSKAII
uniref:L1 transposable element RRM domain-containing protein n=1 Tax=Rousettus aegyptiacus TaxID=9407 RepID=A0A7J8EJQ7_ROUAE|nr:hypothetical protein HJG63_012473 [Rousettus aegyptiacus]